MLQIGDIRLYLINDGSGLADPGGVFGLVPRVLWQRIIQPNDQHLIPMNFHSLLVQASGQNLLVDTGMGHKLDKKAETIWHLERPAGDVVAALSRLDLKPEEINVVVNTHLHLDHCSGNTLFAQDGETARATFPNAVHLVQRREYEDAIQPNERTTATYTSVNWDALETTGQLRFLKGDTEIVPGVWGIVTPGHTPGHMSVRIESKGQHAMFVCDLASYAVHIERLGWMTAYDVEPLITLETKRKWQQWALDTEAILIFPHEPHRPVGRLQLKEQHRPTLIPIDEPYL